MTSAILRGSVVLSVVVLLGCTSRSGLNKVMKITPSIVEPSPAKENTPRALLTQTQMSTSSTASIGCPEPQSDARVEVILDKLTYRRGETILVSVCNYLLEVIFAPPQGDCSVVSVERLKNTHWVTEGSCPALEVYILGIPPRSQVIRSLWPISQGAGDQGTRASEPIPPDVFEGNLRDMPTSTPFQFPAIEVPEGAITPPFSLLKTDLPPGTYHIKFNFTVGQPTGSVQTIYSANFIVID